jgi:hypothetical protein
MNRTRIVPYLIALIIFLLGLSFGPSEYAYSDSIIDDKFNISKSQMRLNQTFFQNKISHNLKGILQDYYSLMEMNNHFYQFFEPIRINIDNSMKIYTNINPICNKIEISKGEINQCLSAYNDLYLISVDLEDKLNNFIQMKSFFDKNPTLNLFQNIDLYLLAFDSSLSLLERVHYWQYLLLNTMTFFEVSVKGHGMFFYQRRMNTTIEEINLIFETMQFRTFDEDIADDYMMVWNGFMKISKILFQGRTPKIFLERLGTWIFFSKMTKW